MRADRLLSIILLLQRQGKMTTQALAEELDVSRRTILRDLDALSAANVPVYTDGGHGGGVALDENYRTTLTGLGEAEIRALFIASGSGLLDQLGLGEAAERTQLKLFAALPQPHQPSVDHIRQRIYIDPLWWWHETEKLPFWDELQQAVYEDWRVRALYENYDGQVAERELEPYSLVAKSGLWYLIARREGELRTYRVSRFHNITLLDGHFQRAADFDLATYWQEHVQEFAANMSVYGFTLRVHERRLNFIRWLAPGRCEILATEGEWLTVQFHYESMDLARMLVFGLGLDAEVIEPLDLREAVVDGAREMLERHKDSAED
jgi:predicted DNA-binding transcriptional regulator YafY